MSVRAVGSVRSGVMAALSVALTAAAGATSGGGFMSAAELMATFDGRTIDGHYENGDRFEETYAKGGVVSYRDAFRQSGGRWSVEANAFCTLYDDDPAGGCYRVRRDGENCFEFYFVARTEAEAKADPRTPHWSARGWFPDKPATCVDGKNV